MMVLAHTPWTRDGMRVLDAQGREVLVGILTRREGEVQLASAAPDLLEACKEARCYLSLMQEKYPYMVVDEVAEHVEAAISKAEGKEEG